MGDYFFQDTKIQLHPYLPLSLLFTRRPCQTTHKMDSGLLFIPASASTTPINWTRVPEASKKVLLDRYGYDWENNAVRPLPATVGDLVKMFDEKAFFGDFRPDVCILMMDISEFGLQAAPGPGMVAGPRFYMSYLEQVWFLLFDPGT